MRQRFRSLTSAMQPSARFAAIALLVSMPIAAGLLSEAPGKDGIRHFIYLHSIVFDRDVDFNNELEVLYPRYQADDDGWVVESTGMARNVSPIGPALTWLPAYLFVVGTRLDPTGMGTWSWIAADVSSAALFSLAVWLAYLLVRDRTSRPALAVGLVAFGSFYLYLWLYPNVMGHAAAVGTCTLYVWLWNRGLDDFSWRRALILGILAGLVALIRWQNALLPLVSVPLWLMRAPTRKDAGLAFAVFGAAVGVMLLPQIITWKSIYGAWLIVPQGGFMHWSKPYFLDTLFSPRYGLVGFSPILYLPLIGLILSGRRRLDPLMLIALVYLPLSLYLNASAGDWYAGASFGARRFDSWFPFLVVGAAGAISAFDEMSRRLPGALVSVVVASSVVFTLVMIGGYNQGAYPVGMVGVERFPERASQHLLHTVGWLPSLPAEAAHWLLRGTRWGQYTALAGDDRMTWLDGRIVPESRHLGAGWTRNEDGTLTATAERGVLFVYLMDLGFHYRDVNLDLMLRGGADDIAEWARDLPAIRVNGESLRGQSNAGKRSIRYRVLVPYEVLRPGINRIEVPQSDLQLIELRLCGAERMGPQRPCQRARQTE